MSMKAVILHKTAKPPEMNKNERFIHGFRSCSRTYATLCIYDDTLDAEQISRQLCTEPDRIVAAGDKKGSRVCARNGWFWTTSGRISGGSAF
jgi:hypothetical protein